MRFRTLIAAAVVVATPMTATTAQRAMTSADYARAERFMNFNTTPLVFGTAVRATWLPNDRFWYRDVTPTGADLLIVDATRGTRSRVFDNRSLAAAIATALGVAPETLGQASTQSELANDGRMVTVSIGGRRVECDIETTRCGAAVDDRERASAGGRGGRGGGRGGRGGTGRPPETMSPDGKLGAFIRDWNLWVRDVASGRETQLTHDGVKDFGYATDNAGWTNSDRAILVWSPDSKKIATFQQDQRGVGDMYLVSTRVGHPELRAWKYPLPGDSVVTMIQRVVIDLSSATPRIVRLQMPPDQHRSTLCDDIACRGGEWADVEWYPDGSHLAFVSTSRDHKHEALRVADAGTGAVRDVLEETVKTQFESGNGRVNWHVLPASNEVIWFSERDNWGQLYLYDLTTGKLKQQITTGEGNVTQLLRIDEKTRTLYFQGVGKEKGRDPYFRHFYKIGMDGKGLTLLTPEDADHDVTLSPSGRFFVDTYSRPEMPQTTVLRDAKGKLVLNVEKADISRLLATGWKPPVPITVKARDGKTDLYGLMYVPTKLDSTKKYPIVNHIYPGPQTGSVGGRSFSAARGDAQSLAELGFVVVEIDGMGTPWRSKAFHDFYYANMGDNTLPDQIAAMKELASRYKWIDIDHAGIYGHSGGGFATADAMFRYPDFFKVGISESGNHDNREYEDDWGERYQGLLERGPGGTTNYDDQANQNMAKNLKGKLLLAHGTMDNNVPPYNTYLVVDALIKANKDFDLLMLPNQPHGYGNESNYMTRRRWDYFVKNLLGMEPPREYELGPKPQAAVRATP
ncbi:MAG TPA: DPP IV N-terminal domain-containing protein [Gemmatimonadaceae bacterium]|nr:DPP IV N-terminal domain-containing protein [Gemmatimonadaceae bacterium]